MHMHIANTAVHAHQEKFSKDKGPTWTSDWYRQE